MSGRQAVAAVAAIPDKALVVVAAVVVQPITHLTGLAVVVGFTTRLLRRWVSMVPQAQLQTLGASAAVAAVLMLLLLIRMVLTVLHLASLALASLTEAAVAAALIIDPALLPGLAAPVAVGLAGVTLMVLLEQPTVAAVAVVVETTVPAVLAAPVL
jgi:hypothetical protein